MGQKRAVRSPATPSVGSVYDEEVPAPLVPALLALAGAVVAALADGDSESAVAAAETLKSLVEQLPKRSGD